MKTSHIISNVLVTVMVSCEEQNWMTAEANMNREHFVYEKSIRLNVTNETLTGAKNRFA